MGKPTVEKGYTLARDKDGLTQRDRDVREQVLAGLSATEIADQLGLTRARVYQILHKNNWKARDGRGGRGKG